MLNSYVNDGYSLDVKGLSTDLSWDFSLVLDADDVGLSQDKKNIFHSSNTHIKIPLVMLVFNRADNTQFFADKAQVYLERDKNKKLNIQKAFKFKQTAGQVPKFRVALKDYAIEFVDYGQSPILLDGYNLDLGNINLYRLKTFGSVTFPDKSVTILNLNFISKKPLNKGNFVLSGNVSNLDFSKINRYIIEFCPEVTSTQGVLNGDFDINAYGREKLTDNLKVSLNCNNVFVSTKKYPHFFEIADDAQIHALGKYHHHRFVFKKFRIVSRDYNIDLVGEIKHMDREVKHLDIKVKSSHSDMKKIMGLVPKTVGVRHDGINKAIKYCVDGFVSCDLKIKGKTSSPKYWGTLNIDNFVVDGDMASAKSSIEILYKKRRLHLNTNLVDASGKVLNISGTSKMGRRPKLNMRARSDGQIILKETRKNLLALSDILGLPYGILPDTMLDGTAVVDLCAKGVGKDTAVSGYLSLYNTRAKYNKLSKQVFIPQGVLKFQNRNIYYNNFITYIDSFKTVLNGRTTLDNDVFLRLTSNLFSSSVSLDIFQHSQLFKQVAESISDVEQLSGNVDFDILLKGNISTEINREGTVNLLGTGILFKGLNAPASGLLGRIDFVNNVFEFKNIKGNCLKSPIEFTGNINNNQIDAKILAPKVDMGSAISSIKTSPALSKLVPALAPIKAAKGDVCAVLTLKGNLKEDFFDKIHCSFDNSSILLEGLSSPVIISSGAFEADNNTLKTEKISFVIFNSKGVLEGVIKNLSESPLYDMKLTLSNIDKSCFEALKNSELPPKTKAILSNVRNFSGSASGVIYIKNKITGKIKFNNVGFVYSSASLPIRLKSGDLLIDDNKISLPNSVVYIAGSAFRLNSYYSKDKEFALNLDGRLSPYDVDNYINKILISPLNLKQTTPLRLKILKDSKGNWNILSSIFLDSGNAISYKGVSVGDASNSYFIGGGLKFVGNQLSFQNLGVNQFSASSVFPLELYNPLSSKNFLEVSGTINLKTLDENLRVYTREFMDINLFNEFFNKYIDKRLFYGGQFKGNLFLKGKWGAPDIHGVLDIKNASLPSFATKIPTLRIVFAKDGIFLQDGIFKIAGSEFNFDGVADNVIAFPYVFRNMDITSSNINIDEIAKVIKKDSDMNGTVPPFVIKKGTLRSSKLVINNLITDDAKAEFSFSPDWKLSLDDFYFKTADGEVTGNTSFDFLTYKIRTNLKFKNLKANAVATTLLQMPNEIYGILNGEAHFSTQGLVRSELIKNSNGHVKFQVISGKLVRLGSLEYLIRAAEVVKSGITGLCINNVCTLLAPQKTGHFDTINVDFKVKDGVLYTDNLVSRGKKLSIYLAGNFDMSTNYSDFTILGKVSKSIMPLLGPVGNLSISKIVNNIPGVDNKDKNLAHIIPGLAKVPGVDFNDKGFRRFIVNIEGDLYDQKSVKNFRWID
ncbi:MAG: AsmA-like C-terminal region-containing protein [Candidatus Gastranaerophilales bacterium]|nr:AsmA-like C-terminal region-containing protein [Candidatus Gastranaerophilales bacterium]